MIRPLDPQDAAAALALWDAFPLDRSERPIVLTALPSAVLDGLWHDARLEADLATPPVPESDLPAELHEAAAWYCHDVHTGEPRPLAPIHRGEGLFGTDRGPRRLPAWLMHPENRRWPFMGLEPEFERSRTWCPPGIGQYHDRAAELAEDGATIVYRFTGTPFAYADYPTADVYESSTAVLVHPVEVEKENPSGIRLAYSDVREVVVRLQRPLADRVLIHAGRGPGSDTFGAAVVVLPAGSTLEG